MLTLKKLKAMVENVPNKKAAVPGIRQLEESEARIIVREMVSDMLITVYQNGYVACRRGRESTVFRLHDCGGYTYWGALEENEEMWLKMFSRTKTGISACIWKQKIA